MRAPLTKHAWDVHGLRRVTDLLSHPYTLLLLTAIAVWLPQGFNIGPANDGWIQMGGGLLRPDLIRVFGSLPIRVGMRLAPGSFVGIQCVILVLMLLHAVFFYEIVRRLLPGREIIALAAGLIGLFHSADRSYFWVGSMGLQFSLAAALGSCVCAIQYLDDRRGRHLAMTVVLQLVSAFTYPAFLPLMLGVPVGAWLLRWLGGGRPPVSFLLKVGASVVVVGGIYWYLLNLGAGRNSRVMDVHVAEAVSGYGWVLRHLCDSIPAMFTDRKAIYLLPILALAVMAYPAAARAARRNVPAQAWTAQDRRHLAVTVTGLLMLALLSYLPYSVSTVRFNAARTMLACGMFAYTALAVVSLALLERRLHKAVLILLIMGLAGYTVLVGEHQRDAWVRSYRAEERLLAAIAASVPHPYPGSVFLVYLHDPSQADDLGGFYNRQRAFSLALGNMYGDSTLSGGFWGFGDDQAAPDTDGIRMRGFRDSEGRLQRYPSLVMVDYPVEGPAKVLDATWLAGQAGANSAATAGYSPRFRMEPAAAAIMCSMLEPALRPAYCR